MYHASTTMLPFCLMGLCIAWVTSFAARRRVLAFLVPASVSVTILWSSVIDVLFDVNQIGSLKLLQHKGCVASWNA